MGWESFGVVRFYLGPLLQGQTRIANSSTPNSLTYWSYRFGMVTLDPSFKVKMRIAKLKSAYNSLIIRRTGLGW